MKIKRIVEAEASVTEYVSYLLAGGIQPLPAVVMPAYAVGDAVALPADFGAVDGIGVVTDVLPHDSDEHGELRCYTVRYAGQGGAIYSRDVGEGRLEGCLLASRDGKLARLLLGDDDMPEACRPIAYLRDHLREVRRTEALDVLSAGDDPLAALEAFGEAEDVVDALCHHLGESRLRDREPAL